MNKNYYALNYRPKEAYYGEGFLYDGENGFNEWKNEKIKSKKKFKYKDYYDMRDAFVHNNREIIDDVFGSNVRQYNVKDVSDFISTATYSDTRIAQTIAAKKSWEKVRDISHGTGTVIGFDIETIGDAVRENLYTVGENLQNYDGHAGITEMGFYLKPFVDGEPVKDMFQEKTIAVGLTSEQLAYAQKILSTYKKEGISALSENDEWMLGWFSRYGHENSYSAYFTVEQVDFLGNNKFVTINTDKLADMDIYNHKAIDQGIKIWEGLMNDKSYSVYTDKAYVLGESVDFLNKNIANDSSTLVAANVGYETTVLSKELESLNIKFDGRNLYENTADIVYANETIAKAQGISVYKMQERTGNKISADNAESPASTQTSMQAAGLEDTKEHHSGGKDSKVEVDVATNKRFIDKSFPEEVLESIEIEEQIKPKDYSKNYYVFKSGGLNKNKMDHAIVNGTETQSYSYRNQYLSIDLEHSGYVPFTPQSKNGITAETQDVYILSMTNDRGDVIRKQYPTREAAFRDIDENAMSISKAYSTTKKRIQQREYQESLNYRDLARREYDRMLNSTDIRTSGKEEINGFNQIKKVLDFVNEIDESGKGLKYATNARLDEIGFKSVIQKRTFEPLYDIIENEKSVLNYIVNYIDDNMSTANNTQKTMALNNMMSTFKKEVETLEFVKYVPFENTMILEDALGIDILVNKKEYTRINGSSEETIKKGLRNIFRNSTKEDIIESINDLKKRGVLTANVLKDIQSINLPRSTYHATIIPDMAKSLFDVMEPITSNKGGPISFFESLDEGHVHYKAVTNKIVKSINNDIQDKSSSIYIVNSSKITLSELFEGAKEVFEEKGLIKEKFSKIVSDSYNAEFIDGRGMRNKFLAQLGDELNYNHNQKKILVSLFEAKDKKRGGYKDYAIDGRKDIHAFIIPPVEKANGSAFLILTNDAHQANVNEILYSSNEDILKAESRKNIEEIVEGHASVIELKNYNKVKLGTFDQFGIPKEVAQLFGVEDVNVSTVKQGKTAEKFMVPVIDSYITMTETGEEIFNIGVKQAGDSYSSAIRTPGAKVLDFVSEGEFSRGTRAGYQPTNSYMKTLSSPSSGRAYKDANGQLKRAINYNLNDLLHGFYIDGSGVRKTFEYEAEYALRHGIIDSPIYQMVEAIGLQTDKIGKNGLDLDSLKNILSSNEWNEFYVKNLFLGAVNDDKSFAEAISKFGISNQTDVFNKNIITMITDFAREHSDAFSKYSIATLEGIQKASPYLSQLLSETNVKNDIWTLLNAGDLIDLGGLNATLRPTYGQVLNALMFNPSELNYFANDTIIGATSKSLYEKIIFDNIDIESPSGLPYNTQERLVTTTFKQMSDAELQLRYREIYDDLENLARDNNLDIKKLEETYKIFTNEYMSVYESKVLGAPKFFNQEHFTSTDIKKISMPQLSKLEGNAKEITERTIKKYLTKELNTGDIIGYSGGNAIYYEGPTTILTEDNIKELFKNGETRVVPSSRAGMITDIKVMFQQEKATMHFALIDDVFMKKNTIYQNKDEAMKYMQKMFHFVVGYDGTGYEPVAFGVLDSFKHGTNIASDSTFRVIAHEYEKAGRLKQLQNALNNMEEFKGWNFSIDKKHGREYLVSNQKNKTGMTNAIHKLHDVIMDDTKRKAYGLDFDGFNIKDTLNHMRKNNLAYLEMQRMNMNEIMGTSVTLDERMQQAIRLRAVNDGNYYIGEYEITDANGIKRKVQAVDGVLDGVNGRVINGKGRRWDDLYLDELKSDISKGVYDKMDVSEFNEFPAIKKQLLEQSAERQAKFKHQRKAVAKQKNIIGGIKESVMWYNGKFKVEEHDVINVNMKSLLKKLPKKGGITADDLQDFIFKTDGEPSRYLKELTGNNVSNKTAIYLDFGTTIGDKKGMLIPLIDVNTTGKDVFFNRIEGSIIKFFNEYQAKIGTVTGKEEIKKALDNLYTSFARELVVFDKDSLAYKTMGRILLPNSTQSLAHDAIAPLVDAIIDDPFIKDSIKLEKEYRMAIADGDMDAVKKLDDLLKRRKEIANEVADVIKSGNITDDSYYKLAGLSTVGRADKGYIDYVVSDDGLMRPIKYTGDYSKESLENLAKEGKSIKRVMTNTFDTSLKNLQDHGLDIDKVNLQLLRDYLENGKMTSYETNAAFDNFMKNVDFAKISSDIQELAEKYGADFELSQKGLVGDIENFMISIKDLNDMIVDGSKNELKKANDVALREMYEILDSYGIAKRYLSEVGILTREVNRYPIFKAQSIARIFLNEGIEGSETRSNNPIIAIVNNADHDGDMYMSSLDLNGGGIKTIKNQANLIAAYENSLFSNNEMFAKLVKKEVAFKADDITDISLYRLKELEKLDNISYKNVMQEWIMDNNLSGSVEDLSEGQILAAAHHSKKVRKAVETFDTRRNSLTDLDMLKAALVSRVRKENIGSISTPNFKLRDTLETIYSNSRYQDVDRKKAFNILKHLTDLKGEGLTDITEQKGIDVKHIFDAVDIAETPKWVKGTSMLFNKNGYDATSQKGLYLMMEAANNSTFKLDKNVLEKIHKDILNSSLEDLEKRSLANEKEVLNKLLKSSYTTFTDDQVEEILNFTIKFRALYDSTTLPEAFTIHNSIFRNKTTTHKAIADALEELEHYNLSDLSKDSVLGDFIKEYNRHYSDVNLLIDDKTVYFKTGDVAKRKAKTNKQGIVELQDSISDRAYILKNVDTNKGKYKVTLQEVDMKTLEPIKDSTYGISGKNYQDINLKLRKFLDDTKGVNKYLYNNSDFTRSSTLAELRKNKFSRNLNAIIFNTGYDDKKGFEAFNNFISLGKQKRHEFGDDIYDFIGAHIKNKSTIENIRELIEDARWAINEGKVSKENGVPALIKQLNEAIVKDSENFTRTFSSNFDDFYEEFLEKNLFHSKNTQEQIRKKRLSLGDFKNDVYTEKIDYLNKNIYGTINARKRLDNLYDSLEVYKSRLKKDSIPKELNDFLNARGTTIDTLMDKVYQHNDKIIKDVQGTVYGLFENTDQMDLKFDWEVSRGNSIVGFGEYLGTSFSELKQQDIDKILSTDISQEALDNISNPYERYATQRTVELLNEYNTSGITPGTITDSRPIMNEIGDFTSEQSVKFGKMINDTSPEMIKPIEKKRLSDSFKGTFSSIPKKTIGIAVGALAALGITNNLLHGDKNQSPLTPARRANGSDNSPNMTSPAGNTPVSQAPMSQQRTVYHDRNRGLNFKVSASTNRYINDINNAKLIGMSGGGQASVYSQADTSGVTDNWLANKFAELA